MVHCFACAAWDWKSRSQKSVVRSQNEEHLVRTFCSVFRALCSVLTTCDWKGRSQESEVRSQNEEELLSAVHFLPSALCSPPVSPLAIPPRRGRTVRPFEGQETRRARNPWAVGAKPRALAHGYTSSTLRGRDEPTVNWFRCPRNALAHISILSE
jgi:hypothetical protein